MKKLNIRLLSLLLALVCLLGCFTACDNSSNPSCDHIEGSWIVDQEATYDSTGQRHTECTICGETINTETIPKETCTHINSKWIVDVKATLYSDGSQHLECKSCGKTLKTETIPKESCSHIFTKWVVDVEATLTIEGRKHLECNTCGKTLETETIPKETCSHISTKWVIDEEATLDAEGSKHLECRSCGKTIKTEVIPELYLTESEITSKLRPSVVKVTCYDYDGTTEISQGTGFFIDSVGTFITNAHVVEGCYFIKVKTYLGIEHDVDVMYKYNYTTSDYAICNAKNCFSSTPVEFATSADVGDTVYALGYPNDAFLLRTTSGEITSNNTVDGTKNYYANTAWIDHGSSGGILADDKGRVLGITTGIFADGEYAALKYQDFKFDASGFHIGGKAPVEYFHTVDEVWLGSHNLDEYFDIIVQGTATSDTNVSYLVTVELKDKYKTKKIVIDSFNISITVKLDTDYSYTEVTSYGTYNRTKTDTNYLYFYFYNNYELSTGDMVTSSSFITLSYSTEYYGMNITYDADFFGGSGTIIIYDKYGL